MKFDLTQKQAYAYLKLKDKVCKEVGYGGAAGGGKSILGCFWVLTQCIDYPGTAWVIGRKELTNLKKTTLLSFFQVLQILDISPERLFRLNSQTNTMDFHNGSKIFLMDMSKQPSDPLYTRFGGLELTGAFIDESNENDLMAIEILKTRLGRCKNKEYNLIPKLLETFNPSKNHVYTRYYKPFKDQKLPDHRIFITALATDNPYLDYSYIEQLKNADKVTRERLLYGNFEYDDDPTKLFEYEKILDIFSGVYPEGPHEQNYLTCDVARKGKDKTVVMIWKGLQIQKIYTEDISDLRMLSKRIEQFCIIDKIPFSNVIIDEDGLGGGVVDNLKEFRPQVKGFINNSSAIETEYTKKFHNYANLKTQCYFKLQELVNKGKIGCLEVPLEIKELIIQDLEQIAQKDPDKERKIQLVGKEEMKEKLGRSPDFSDTMMMRMYFEVRGTYTPFIA